MSGGSTVVCAAMIAGMSMGEKERGGEDLNAEGGRRVSDAANLCCLHHVLFMCAHERLVRDDVPPHTTGCCTARTGSTTRPSSATRMRCAWTRTTCRCEAVSEPKNWQPCFIVRKVAGNALVRGPGQPAGKLQLWWPACGGVGRGRASWFQREWISSQGCELGGMHAVRAEAAALLPSCCCRCYVTWRCCRCKCGICRDSWSPASSCWSSRHRTSRTGCAAGGTGGVGG